MLFSFSSKFQFKKLVAGVGDFVLISNADSAEPDTEEGCDAARIVALYEDISSNSNPFRAKVQWYSRPSDLPNWCFNKIEPIDFMEKEVSKYILNKICFGANFLSKNDFLYFFLMLLT